MISLFTLPLTGSSVQKTMISSLSILMLNFGWFGFTNTSIIVPFFVSVTFMRVCTRLQLYLSAMPN